MSENQKAELQDPVAEPKKLVAASKEMLDTLRLAEQVGKFSTTVLLTGETGVGKERIARHIHDNSARKGKNFIPVNSGGFSVNLIHSELFGHEEGAYTDAASRRLGAFELAKGGTLFLDEIGDMPPDIQVLFLRVLETGEFTRLGGEEILKANARIIAATNRDLEQLTFQERKFRLDLYYRLNVFPIHIPALQERRSEIPELTQAFIDEINTEFKNEDKKRGTVEEIDPDAVRHLESESHPWIGNVRELRNVIERALIYAENAQEKEIKREHLYIAEAPDLPGVFERLMSKRGLSKATIIEGYKRGPHDYDYLLRTLSALVSQRFTIQELSKMSKQDREANGYVAIGAVNSFVKIFGVRFFGEGHNTTSKFIRSAIEELGQDQNGGQGERQDEGREAEQEENKSVDDASERENANEIPKG